MEYKTIFIYFVIIFVLVIVIYWFTPYLDALNPYLGNIKGYFLGCEWVTGSWGQCEEPCGKSNKKRSVLCKDKYGIDSTYCDINKKPIEVESCNMGTCSLWKAGPWSECSKKCGMGIQTRTVSCSDFGGKLGTCRLSTKPKEEQQCETQKCGKWVTSEWTPCSPQCGEGTMTRLVDCITPDGTSVNTCQEKKPISTSTCSNKNKCGKWEVGQWEPCSVKCGGGKQIRTVKCVDESGKEIDNCVLADFPGVVQQCNMQPCGTWKTGEWNKCSKLCDGGIQVRDVTCVTNDGKTISSADCQDEKPPITQPCNTQACPK